MSDEELFDQAISASVDAFLTPEAAKIVSPTASSTLSSGEAQGQQFLVTDVPGHFVCDKCRKVLKTAKGFANHMFLHNIAEANLRKPKIQDIIPCISEFLLEAVDEILVERNIPEEKRRLVEEVKTSLNTPNGLHFSFALSEKLCDVLTVRVKVLPANHYQDILSRLNFALNDQEYFNSLKSQCQAMCSDELKNSVYFGNVIFRIFVILGQKIQTFVMKEMKESTSSSSTLPDTNFPISNETEEKAFEEHMGRVVRTYYGKVCSLNLPVWRVRCQSIRKEFVVFANEDVSSSCITDRSMWEQNIRLSHAALGFFSCVEHLIQDTLKVKSKVSLDLVMERLKESPQQKMLHYWSLLTSDHLSEDDSLTFMRDFVSIIVNLSVRFEEKRIQLLEGREKTLAQFALRTSLKRN